MRISTLQAFNNGVAGLQRNYANVTRTQEQISTGNRILTPARMSHPRNSATHRLPRHGWRARLRQ